MTTKTFDAMPTPCEAIDFKDISDEKVKTAWAEYKSKPEYKEFNKHDMIESMQSCKIGDDLTKKSHNN
ncbi:NF038105 family protein [Acinetobacter sp. MD2(2019)]|uniref:NF038105 family protein n=1 Tax=Acinetobacter sp. MD2(2019) TaxID=2605273 RepID=UPI002D1E8B59|nr:NF038105 family protein [Acinetobacter sp. MD2(2019)]MEB3753484.1 NF038105 family protein [Acinetobacter sp. MD2(2019)]